MFFLFTLVIYGLGLVLTAVGGRLTGRCATWCCALCGLPLWVVSGTVASLCVALPQLALAFLASGLGITGLAVGAALAGAVTDLGLVLALCLLRRSVMVDRGAFCRKCGILLAGLRGASAFCQRRHAEPYRRRAADGAFCGVCAGKHRLPAPALCMTRGFA